MRVARLLLVFVLAAASTAAARAALPTLTHQGRPYVELFRVAESIGGKLDATTDGPRAQLSTAGHVVVFTRNSSRLVVDGKPVLLDAPVRVKRGVWLVPETFVKKTLPVLAGPAAATGAGATAAAPARPPEASLEDLRIRSYPSFTRIVLETSGPVSHRVEAVGPKEVRIRIAGLRSTVRVEQVADGFIDEARLERAGGDAVLRVGFATAAGEPRASTLADPPRLVLDWTRPHDESQPDRGTPAGPLRTIVLDAGHGGHDSGAVGPTGLYEKDLVLDVARRVARLLEDRLDVRVLLSRDGDQFVALRDRTSFANKHRADLFVSIHGNAHQHSSLEGIETYFLSSEATDTAARQVAALENGVVQLEAPASPASRSRTDVVRTILWDLAQSEFQHESSRLAEIVLDAMTQSLKIPARGVKQGDFYVLGGAAMPAVLVEVGFVTNPREERRLKDTRYRDELARAIFTGLAAYKRDYDQRMRAGGDRAR